eukprot:Lankesteria_metandrocarpae@DN523_c0_g1_i1.p1
MGNGKSTIFGRVTVRYTGVTVDDSGSVRRPVSTTVQSCAGIPAGGGALDVDSSGGQRPNLCLNVNAYKLQHHSTAPRQSDGVLCLSPFRCSITHQYSLGTTASLSSPFFDATHLTGPLPSAVRSTTPRSDIKSMTAAATASHSGAPMSITLALQEDMGWMLRAFDDPCPAVQVKLILAVLKILGAHPPESTRDLRYALYIPALDLLNDPSPRVASCAQRFVAFISQLAPLQELSVQRMLYSLRDCSVIVRRSSLAAIANSRLANHKALKTVISALARAPHTPQLSTTLMKGERLRDKPQFRKLRADAHFLLRSAGSLARHHSGMIVQTYEDYFCNFKQQHLKSAPLAEPPIDLSVNRNLIFVVQLFSAISANPTITRYFPLHTLLLYSELRHRYRHTFTGGVTFTYKLFSKKAVKGAATRYEQEAPQTGPVKVTQGRLLYVSSSELRPTVVGPDSSGCRSIGASVGCCCCGRIVACTVKKPYRVAELKRALALNQTATSGNGSSYIGRRSSKRLQQAKCVTNNGAASYSAKRAHNCSSSGDGGSRSALRVRSIDGSSNITRYITNGCGDRGATNHIGGGDGMRGRRSTSGSEKLYWDSTSIALTRVMENRPVTTQQQGLDVNKDYCGSGSAVTLSGAAHDSCSHSKSPSAVTWSTSKIRQYGWVLAHCVDFIPYAHDHTYADGNASSSGSRDDYYGGSAAGGSYCDRSGSAAGGSYCDRSGSAGGGSYCDRSGSAGGGSYCDRSGSA